MSVQTKEQGAKLTDYEAEQVEEIAAWKSEPPNPFAEMFKMVTIAGARVVEQAIPDAVVREAIEKSYDAAELIAGQEDVKRQAGVQDLGELRHRPLEECDRMATRVSVASQAMAIAGGTATGAGGVATTILDIPVLFVLSLRTILKIGHCYGYPLDRPKDRRFVLGVLLVATSSSLEVMQARLDQLREIEDWLLEEAQQDIIAEEAASLLFQIEVFEDIPGLGAISGGLLNLAFIRRVIHATQRIFQERWLRDNGKVEEIAPAEVHGRVTKTGWAGALARAAYRSSYYVGFGATLPVWFVASFFQPMNNAMTRGLHDGAAAATLGVDHLLGRVRGAIGSNGAAAAPALAAAPA